MENYKVSCVFSIGEKLSIFLGIDDEGDSYCEERAVKAKFILHV